jgi:drug/metabolite transporter (DMT)-like permease
MSLEEFNKHQQDVRVRTDSLARAVFILAGGALSISIGLFLNSKLSISHEIVSLLKFSWAMLALSILSLILMLTTVISRDYFFGERCRVQLNNSEPKEVDSHYSWDVGIWVLAMVGLFSFIVGFALLTYAATELLVTM